MLHVLELVGLSTVPWALRRASITSPWWGCGGELQWASETFTQHFCQQCLGSGSSRKSLADVLQFTMLEPEGSPNAPPFVSIHVQLFHQETNISSSPHNLFKFQVALVHAVSIVAIPSVVGRPGTRP